MTQTIVGTTRCGSTQMTLPRLALGSWHTWDRAVFEDAVRMVRRAVEAGAAMFDIGVYRAGFDVNAYDSPTDIVLSRAIQAADIPRSDYTLSIKGWMEIRDEHSLAVQVENILFRHGTDHADLIVLGDFPVAPGFDWAALAQELADVISAGTVRAWGINNWTADMVSRGDAAAKRAGIAGPQLAQMVYGLTHRSVPEGEPYRQLMADTGIGLQASDIFDGGVLLGQGSGRHTGGDVGTVRERAAAMRSDMQAAAESIGASLPQLALLYPLANPATSNVLVGVRTSAQLGDLLGAFPILERVGAEAVREVCAPFWLDKDTVDPASGGV